MLNIVTPKIKLCITPGIPKPIAFYLVVISHSLLSSATFP